MSDREGSRKGERDLPAKLPHSTILPIPLVPSALLMRHWYTPAVLTAERYSELLVPSVAVVMLVFVRRPLMYHSTREEDDELVKEQERLRGVPKST